MLQQQKTCPGPKYWLALMIIEVAKILTLHATTELTALYQRISRLIMGVHICLNALAVQDTEPKELICMSA